MRRWLSHIPPLPSSSSITLWISVSLMSVHPANVLSSFTTTCCYARQPSNVKQTQETLVRACSTVTWREKFGGYMLRRIWTLLLSYRKTIAKYFIVCNRVSYIFSFFTYISYILLFGLYSYIKFQNYKIATIFYFICTASVRLFRHILVYIHIIFSKIFWLKSEYCIYANRKRIDWNGILFLSEYYTIDIVLDTIWHIFCKIGLTRK